VTADELRTKLIADAIDLREIRRGGGYMSHVRERISAQIAQDLRPALIEIGRLKQWVNDLQSGMYINCVYCGHRYGPSDEVPASMAEVLKEHIEVCPEHPMSKVKARAEQLRDVLREAESAIESAIYTEDGLDGAEGTKVLKIINPLIRTPEEMEARAKEIAGWPVV